MYRVIAYFHDSGDLSSDDVVLVCRAPYFGQFRWGLHFSPPVTDFTRFDELRMLVAAVIRYYPHVESKLTYSSAILQFNLYGNDPILLRAMRPFMAVNATPGRLQFNSLRVIQESCWHWRLPPRKPKGLYYNRFRYRIQFKDTKWAANVENIKALEQVTGAFSLSHTRQNFLYCAEVRDVILAKLLFTNDIHDISERSLTDDTA